MRINSLIHHVWMISTLTMVAGCHTAEVGGTPASGSADMETRLYEMPTLTWPHDYRMEDVPAHLFRARAGAVGDRVFVRTKPQYHEATQSLFDLLERVSKQQAWPDEVALDAVARDFADGTSLRAYLLPFEPWQSVHVWVIKVIIGPENQPEYVHLGRLLLLRTTETGHATLREHLPALEQAVAEDS